MLKHTDGLLLMFDKKKALWAIAHLTTGLFIAIVAPPISSKFFQKPPPTLFHTISPPIGVANGKSEYGVETGYSVQKITIINPGEKNSENILVHFSAPYGLETIKVEHFGTYDIEADDEKRHVKIERIVAGKEAHIILGFSTPSATGLHGHNLSISHKDGISNEKHNIELKNYPKIEEAISLQEKIKTIPTYLFAWLMATVAVFSMTSLINEPKSKSSPINSAEE